MTKQPRKEHTGGTPSPGASPLTAPQDIAEYALAVGKRVTELVEKALERGPSAIRTDPNSMAEAITDLVLDKIADPDRSEMAELVAPCGPRSTLVEYSESLGRRCSTAVGRAPPARRPEQQWRLLLSRLPVREAGREGTSQARLAAVHDGAP